MKIQIANIDAKNPDLIAFSYWVGTVGGNFHLSSLLLLSCHVTFFITKPGYSEEIGRIYALRSSQVYL